MSEAIKKPTAAKATSGSYDSLAEVWKRELLILGLGPVGFRA